MANYKQSVQIELDLEEIWQRGFENWGKNQADEYHNQFFTYFEKLSSHKLRGKQDLDVLVEENAYRYKCGSHDIIYQIKPDYIYIIRILHQSMDYSLHL